MTASMDLLVKRSALGETSIVPSATMELGEGEALMRVDAFALTANNVTYGAFGDLLKYWNFFPAPRGWGRVPVWGFATVLESRSDSVTAGERVYGYLPMSTAFKLKPGARNRGGFSDTSPHRAGLAPVYNSYLFNSEDPLYTAQTENLQMLFRPLFVTSFLIDDFVSDASYWGAEQVVFSSASAKTAYAAAQLLKARGGARVIGLTSARNLGFVEGLGFYDEVATYPDVAGLDGSVATVFVDIAGDSAVRAAVHRVYGDRLTYSCAVGATHWDMQRPAEALPGAKPQMFFAPAIVQKRVADWGGAGFQRRIADAWRAFLPTAAKTTDVAEGRGLDDAAKLFSDLVAGRQSPREGHVFRLG